MVMALAAVVASLGAGSAEAATAPANAPVLTSAPYAWPATFRWTPGADPANASQGVYRSSGECTQPPAAGGPIMTGLPAAQTDFTAGPVDGIYCYTIRTTDLAGGTATSPGLTVAFDRVAPTATIAVAGANGGASVAGAVRVTGGGTDAVSGVASSVLRVGVVGACPAGPVIGTTWDTTGYANGTYDVCNVVTDNAGHSATARVTVTVSNALQPAAAASAAPGGAVPAVVPRASPVELAPPAAPTRLTLVLGRARSGATTIPLRLRWTNPADPDLARVSVILNPKRAPRDPADGRVVYSGLETAVGFTLRVGQTAHVALFAYDRSGAFSTPARRVVSLAPLVPLRPVDGRVVERAPRRTG